MSTPGSTYCTHCGATLASLPHKALSGETQTCWTNIATGEWVCPVNGNEHLPGVPKRPVTVTIAHGSNSTMVRLSLAEYGNFLARPVMETLDDGEASWDLQERDPERHQTLATWAAGLYGVTR